MLLMCSKGICYDRKMECASQSRRRSPASSSRVLCFALSLLLSLSRYCRTEHLQSICLIYAVACVIADGICSNAAASSPPSPSTTCYARFLSNSANPSSSLIGFTAIISMNYQLPRRLFASRRDENGTMFAKRETFEDSLLGAATMCWLWTCTPAFNKIVRIIDIVVLGSFRPLISTTSAMSRTPRSYLARLLACIHNIHVSGDCSLSR